MSQCAYRLPESKRRCLRMTASKKHKYCWQHSKTNVNKRGGNPKINCKKTEKSNVIKCKGDTEVDCLTNNNYNLGNFECKDNNGTYECNNSPMYICPKNIFQSKKSGKTYQVILNTLVRNYPDFNQIGIKSYYTPSQVDQIEQGLPTLYIVYHTARLQTASIDWNLFEQVIKQVQDSKKIMIIAMQTPPGSYPDEVTYYGTTILVTPLVFDPDKQTIDTIKEKEAITKITKFIS